MSRNQRIKKPGASDIVDLDNEHVRSVGKLEGQRNQGQGAEIGLLRRSTINEAAGTELAELQGLQHGLGLV